MRDTSIVIRTVDRVPAGGSPDGSACEPVSPDVAVPVTVRLVGIVLGRGEGERWFCSRRQHSHREARKGTPRYRQLGEGFARRWRMRLTQPVIGPTAKTERFDPHIESHSEVCCGGTVSSCVTVIAGIPLKANLKAVGVKSS
jgi:hypothetical protein